MHYVGLLLNMLFATPFAILLAIPLAILLAMQSAMQLAIASTMALTNQLAISLAYITLARSLAILLMLSFMKCIG